MSAMSTPSRQMSWHRQPRRVSVLAEMALRQEKVSQRLRELRELQGLSQEDAARKVGITQRQWQRWESGESMPYPRSLDMVASAFEISVAEFFDPPEPIASDPSQLDRIEAGLERTEGLLKCLVEALPAAQKTKAMASLRDFLGGDPAELFQTHVPSNNNG